MYIYAYTYMHTYFCRNIFTSCPSSTLNKYISNSILSKKKGVAHGD